MKNGVEKLSRALGYRTVSRIPRKENDYEEYRKFLGFLEEAYPAFFKSVEVERVNTYSLLCRLRGREAVGEEPERSGFEEENGSEEWSAAEQGHDQLYPVLFLAHYDVVPAGKEEEWSHPPFSGAFDEESIWGRGAVDDKGPLIALLEGAERLLENGERPWRTVVFAFGHDEEIGGSEGAKALALRLEERGEYFSFILDEGMTIVESDMFPLVDKDLALIGISEKGQVDIELRNEDVPGHASAPPASTAAGKVAKAVSRIEANPFSLRMTKPVVEFLKAIAPYTGGMRRLLLSRPRLFSPLITRVLGKQSSGNAMVRTTQAVTMLTGSEKENVLPSESSAVVNCRILPGDSIDTVIKRYEDLINNPRVEVRPLPSLQGNDPLPISETESEGFRKVSEAVSEVFPETVVAPSLVFVTTDSRHYASLSRNIYRFIPFRLNKSRFKEIHGYNEHVSIEDFARAIDFYRTLLRSL